MALLKLSGGIEQTLEPGQRYWLICGNEQQMQQRFDACAEVLNPLAPGQIGALEGTGGLLSNLRVWENLALPAWYHRQQSLAQLEVRFQEAFAQLGLEGKALTQLAAALPASLDRERKRQLVLVRAYMQEARYLLADQDWFGWISQSAPHACKDLFERMTLAVPLVVVGIGAPDPALHMQEILPLPQTEVW
ncbi:ABC-type lipoprotein export system ATPase subunit [Silvimonas terrae]|uniref:ABC-type lipoprotein export system ATPase subunit n=1 Tax=Silvimonas terrae TaxID=300266 RepID=A0A840R9K5_9NEIS|nr:hypothetical protein [Silvimonas terrae]MBB5190035.1 ABC-type lipoprotein export system ATPase subunit [Silvimonas terrae]